MCMDERLNLQDKRDWLERHGDTVTLYKTVLIGRRGKKEAMYPVYVNEEAEPFKRYNSLKKITSKKSRKRVLFGFHNDDRYVAYFHFYEYQESAELLCQYHPNRIVIECQVPKSSITEIGMQGGDTVVVAQKFTIVEADKYLKSGENDLK